MSSILVPRDPTTETRRILDLGLPEQVVVWAFRHHSSEEPNTPLTDGLARVFGADTAVVVTASVARARRTLERHGRPGMQIATPLAPSLSELEEAVLGILAALQRYQPALALAQSARVVRGDGRNQLRDALTSIAAVLMSQDLWITATATTPSQLTQAANDSLSQGPERLLDRALSDTAPEICLKRLTEHESLIVRAIRHWVGNVLAGNPGRPEIHKLLSTVALQDVATALDGFLDITGASARRPVAINCPRCAALTPDEARVLHAIANCQRGDPMPGFEMLSTWLPPTSVRVGLKQLEMAAQALTVGGTTLPRRAWLFPELDQGATSWAAIPPAEATTVH